MKDIEGVVSGTAVSVVVSFEDTVTFHPRLMKTYHATIMIVDDDPNDLFLIERAFRKIGVTDPIQTVSGGREAIAYIMGEGKYADRKRYAYPTFITTDLKMPVVDGFSVLQHLRDNPEWAVIPTVVLTSSHDLDDIKKAYMLGASSYHVKPASAEALRAQLKVLHEYWMTCEVPQVDSSGRQLRTDSEGKLGERFQQPARGPDDNTIQSKSTTNQPKPE
ncbi:MAG TPA: response regulator [Verrucomicrobiae bacterium]|nr:response regulator [Verrucomicrobiae bacterium]